MGQRRFRRCVWLEISQRLFRAVANGATRQSWSGHERDAADSREPLPRLQPRFLVAYSLALELRRRHEYSPGGNAASECSADRYAAWVFTAVGQWRLRRGL